MTPKLLPATPSNVSLCARALVQGELVAFPTETVYGLGASIADANAIKRVFSVKGRPSTHPLIVHSHSVACLAEYLDLTYMRSGRSIESLVDTANEQVWPGPLTLLVPRGPKLNPAICANSNLVGVRIPRHDVAFSLLKEAGIPIVGPSANTFGKVSPTAATDVLKSFPNESLLILDGGQSEIGVESTIVNLTSDPISILRLGAVSSERLSELWQTKVEVASHAASLNTVSGTLPSHYKPRANITLVSDVEQALKHLSTSALSKIGIWAKVKDINQIEALVKPAPDAQPNGGADHQLVTFSEPDSSKLWAAHLYRRLHEADALGLQELIVVLPHFKDELGLAVLDRLTRASTGKPQNVAYRR